MSNGCRCRTKLLNVIQNWAPVKETLRHRAASGSSNTPRSTEPSAILLMTVKRDNFVSITTRNLKSLCLFFFFGLKQWNNAKDELSRTGYSGVWEARWQECKLSLSFPMRYNPSLTNMAPPGSWTTRIVSLAPRAWSLLALLLPFPPPPHTCRYFPDKPFSKSPDSLPLSHRKWNFLGPWREEVPANEHWVHETEWAKPWNTTLSQPPAVLQRSPQMGLCDQPRWACGRALQKNTDPHSTTQRGHPPLLQANRWPRASSSEPKRTSGSFFCVQGNRCQTHTQHLAATSSHASWSPDSRQPPKQLRGLSLKPRWHSCKAHPTCREIRSWTQGAGGSSSTNLSIISSIYLQEERDPGNLDVSFSWTKLSTGFFLTADPWAPLEHFL